MASNGRTRTVALVVLSAALTAAGCGSSGGSNSSSSSSSSPIKIGVLMELSGPGSDYGTRGKKMVQMALDEIGGKIAGHPIKVFYADTATKPATAVTKVRELVERDKVSVIFGPIFSDAQDAIAPYLGQKQIMAMAPIGANWTLSKYKNWVVYPGTLDSFCRPGGDALKSTGHTTVSTLGADYVAGHQIIEPVGQTFQAAGGKWVQKLYAPLGTSDFGSYISSLKNVDALAAWTIMPDELSLIQSFIKFKHGSGTDLFLCEAENVTPEQLKGLGTGVLGTRGMIASYSPDLQNAENKAFLAKYQQQFGGTPRIADGDSYLLFKILLAGLKKDGGDPSLDKLRPAILSMQQNTVAGPVAWTQNGFALANRYLATVSKGANGNYIWKTDKVFQQERDPRDK
jgi:branched-chain amino acid transport system substrate-binding protein